MVFAILRNNYHIAKIERQISTDKQRDTTHFFFVNCNLQSVGVWVQYYARVCMSYFCLIQ